MRRRSSVPALQVICTLSRNLLQERGYRNTGGVGHLEGDKEVGYGAYPAPFRLLR
jgi:hypothetical protein